MSRIAKAQPAPPPIAARTRFSQGNDSRQHDEGRFRLGHKAILKGPDIDAER